MPACLPEFPTLSFDILSRGGAGGGGGYPCNSLVGSPLDNFSLSFMSGTNYPQGKVVVGGGEAR